MNHNVASRISAEFAGTFTVSLIWIGDVKRTMEAAVRLAKVYLIKSLWSPVVPFALLGSVSASP